MLWDDHIGGKSNATLSFVGVSSSTGGKYDGGSFLSLDPGAGVTSLMSFVVDDRLEDQNGLGFVVQDGFMFSQTSCVVENPFTGRFDVAVPNDVNPTRIYLEELVTDSIQRVSVVEIDITPPSQPIAVNSAYSLWSINLTAQITFYGIAAEIDGVKYSTTDTHAFIEFPLCPT
ncbi:hypothetical protein K438DRAFT_1999855 [Mycena galopus ATCC 62051]|nr:hypothetical protein K438DRAFT_1999855 [Mycena galopus ATCC 62051]